MVNRLSKAAAATVLICIVLIYILVFLTACSGVNKTEYTEQSVTVAPTFNDVFLSFSELKNTSVELLNERPSEQWWSKFNSVYGSVGSIKVENNKFLNSESLGEVDRRLANVLDNTLKSYNEGFEIMKAAYGNDDAEIIDYAFNEFSSKLQSANVAWESAVDAATLLTQTQEAQQ